MKYLGIPNQRLPETTGQRYQTNPMDICDFISYLKVDHSAACVSTYVCTIGKFYTMNDVTTLNWKKIKSFMGEHEKVAEDRPYTHSEIQTLIAHTTSRNRAIILLMSSQAYGWVLFRY